MPHLSELWLLSTFNPSTDQTTCRVEHLPGGLPALRTLVVDTVGAVHGGCLKRLTGLEALDVSEHREPLSGAPDDRRESRPQSEVLAWPPSLNSGRSCAFQRSFFIEPRVD